MRVFKFGGASVKDAKGVKNLYKVLKYTGYKDTIIVVSAMGKMTNSFEKLVDLYFENRIKIGMHLNLIKNFHQKIIDGLFFNYHEAVYSDVKKIFSDLHKFLKKTNFQNYNFVYDQIVSYGEILSTTIIFNYLKNKGLDISFIDARNCIITDNNYRDSNLDWNLTVKKINIEIEKGKSYITQGFISSDNKGNTTTLGREGSDYSASIFAYSLNANDVTIWKDVPGVLNADPRFFSDTTLLTNISYSEAIELAFYGASVIHPKTLQPLQRKNIPLYVKSFLNPKMDGTTVSKGVKIKPLIPCFILKPNQTLLKLSSLDFSFIVEKNISQIFELLHKYQMKVDMIQNSAISFSVCVNNKFGRLDDLVKNLNTKFKVDVNENVDLYTVRHFNQKSIDKIKNNGKKILLEQRANQIVQFVTI
ncbi:MAG: aspartate kinase [Flavobacteriaceae bacterium]|nr:aspartate kinase [Flavobacteriaceae bacterium]